MNKLTFEDRLKIEALFKAGLKVNDRAHSGFVGKSAHKTTISKRLNILNYAHKLAILKDNVYLDISHGQLSVGNGSRSAF